MFYRMCLFILEIVNITQYKLYPYKAECQEPDKPYDTRAVIVL
jgi:hypothetical protein